MAGQLGAFHPAPLPLGACGAYTTAVGAGPPPARREVGATGGRGGRQGVGTQSSHPPLGPPHPPFFPLKDPAAPGGPAGGGAGSGPRPGGRSGGTNAARGGLQPSSGAAAARGRYCAQGRARLGGTWSRAAAGRGPGAGLRPDNATFSAASSELPSGRRPWHASRPPGAHRGQWIRPSDFPNQRAAGLRHSLQ